MAIATLSVRLQAQIAEFQAEFKQAARSTEQFQENFQATATKASAYGNIIAQGIGIAIDAAKQLGEAALENASKIDDLSKKTGLSMRTIQEFQHVAAETGATVDQFANAAFRLGTNLSGGEKGVVKGVKELGLSFDDLRAKSPDEQFRTVIKALEDMDNQQEANRLGVLLFGRTYKEIAVAVAEGYTKLADGARIMKDEQVKRLAEAEDAWKRFGREVVIITGETIATALPLWQEFQRFLANISFPGVLKPKVELTPEQIAFDKSFDELFRRQTAERTQAAKDAAEASEEAAERQKKAFEKARLAAEAYRESILKLRDEFSGARLQADIKKIEEAFSALTEKQKDSVDVQRRVGEAAEELRQKGATLSPELLTLAVRTEKFSEWLNKVPGQTERWARSFDTLRTALTPTMNGLKEFFDNAKLAEGGSFFDAFDDSGMNQATAEAWSEVLRLFPEAAKAVRAIQINPLLEDAGLEGQFVNGVIEINPKFALANGPQLKALLIHELTHAFEGGLEEVAQDLEREALRAFGSVNLAPVEVALGQIAKAREEAFGGQGERGFDQFENFKTFEQQLNEIPKALFDVDFGKQLGTILGNAFRSGDVKGAIQDGASLIGATLGKGLAEKLTTGANALTGWLGGMVSTALPLIGSLLGPLIGKIGDAFTGIFGNRGRDAVKDFAASFGGFDALHARLLEMGAAGEALWIKLTQGVGRNNPEQAAAVIAEVTAALDDFGTESERAATRMAGIGSAIDAINTKAVAFATPFQNLLKDEEVEDVKAKLAAMGEVGQAEFERIGTFAAAAFAGLVKETGDAIGAIQQLGPTFQVLKDGVEQFGLTSTGTIDSLISMFGLVTDAVTGPILQAIQTTGQIFAGLQEGGILTAELFQTVATDIGASFRELEAKGGDVAKAMALSQPVLQRLWEAQQIYGEITDETTAKILKQAEEQGLVGVHMKDVNQKILDVLILIGDVLGAKIPAALRGIPPVAAQTASDIEREFAEAGGNIQNQFFQAGKGIADQFEQHFKDIKVPKVIVDVGWNVDEFLDNEQIFISPKPFASGGIVRRPTLALIGEAGPEAVIPLSQLAQVTPDTGEMTAIFEIDGKQIAAATVPYLPGEIRRYVPA